MEKIQVDIFGLTANPSSGGAYALILKEVGGNRRLPIIIGAFEAQSIALEIEGIKPPRPLTHDLMKNILDTVGTELTEITISELREGTFFATLSLESHELDARPSDAIALAVRFGVPISFPIKSWRRLHSSPRMKKQRGGPNRRRREKKTTSQNSKR